MKKIAPLFLLVAAMLTPACKGDDSCAEVAKQICEAGKTPCDQTKTWLDKQMTGPDDKPLAGDQRAAACKMLLGEKEALAGYTEQAKRDLNGAK